MMKQVKGLTILLGVSTFQSEAGLDQSTYCYEDPCHADIITTVRILLPTTRNKSLILIIPDSRSSSQSGKIQEIGHGNRKWSNNGNCINFSGNWKRECHSWNWKTISNHSHTLWISLKASSTFVLAKQLILIWPKSKYSNWHTVQWQLYNLLEWSIWHQTKEANHHPHKDHLQPMNIQLSIPEMTLFHSMLSLQSTNQ